MKLLIEIPKVLAVLEIVKETIPTVVDNYNKADLNESLKKLENGSNNIIGKCNMATAVINSKAKISINKGPFIIKLEEEHVSVSISDDTFNKALNISKEVVNNYSSLFVSMVKQTHILKSRIKDINK